MHVSVRAIVERSAPAGVEILIQVRRKPGEPKQYEFPGGRVEDYESLTKVLKWREVREGRDTLVKAESHCSRMLRMPVECSDVEVVREALHRALEDANGDHLDALVLKISEEMDVFVVRSLRDQLACQASLNPGEVTVLRQAARAVAIGGVARAFGEHPQQLIG